jgi:hypothetical protein
MRVQKPDLFDHLVGAQQNRGQARGGRRRLMRCRDRLRPVLLPLPFLSHEDQETLRYGV